MSGNKGTLNQVQQHPLIRRLSKSSSLDNEFIKILQDVGPELMTNPGEIFCVSVGKLLVQKVSRLNTIKVPDKTIRTDKGIAKTTKEYCLDLILELLVMISQ